MWLHGCPPAGTGGSLRPAAEAGTVAAITNTSAASAARNLRDQLAMQKVVSSNRISRSKASCQPPIRCITRPVAIVEPAQGGT